MAKEKQKTQDFSFLNENDNATGFEKIGMTEQAIPFLRYAQQISPQLTKSKPEFIEGLNVGEFFNTVTKQNYGETIKIITGGFDHVFIEWLPDRGQGGPVAYHTPENAEKIAVEKTFGKWKTASGNTLQETYMYYILVVGYESEGIAVLSLSSSNISVSKKWNRRLLNTLLPNGEKALPHYLVWNLGTIEASNKQGTWKKLTVDFDGYVDQEQYGAITNERKALPSISSLDLKQLENKDGEVSEGDGKANY